MTDEGSRSATRALSILELLADVERPLSLAEITKELALPKTSVLALLRSLRSRNFATIDAEGRYGLGVQTFSVGAAYLHSMTPARAVETELQLLANELSAASHFAVLDGDEVIYLAKHDPPGSVIKLASSVGARLPATLTAVGKVQLAYASVTATDDLDAGVLSELAEVRQFGYAVDRGRTAAGICCVAAPVLNSDGCCGAIGVSYLLHDDRDIEAISEAVAMSARRASERLGARSKRVSHQ